MTINGTAMWLLALYVALARERGVPEAALRGHDPERHRQGVPGARHVHLPARAVAAAGRRDLRVLRRQRAASGTRRTSAATTCRRPARRRCRRSPSRWPTRSACSIAARRADASTTTEFARASAGSRSSSTPGSGSSRRCARCARSPSCGTRSARERYGVANPKLPAVPLRRAGQLARPHRGAAGEQRVADPARDARRDAVARARCRALQLPTWNEAMSLPRPWDQQWSLRLQQILAYETDLLEYPDLFDGSPVVEAKVDELVAARAAEIDADRRDGRRPRRDRRRLHEGGAGPLDGRRGSARIDARRAGGGRRQQVDRGPAVAAGRRRRRRRLQGRRRGRPTRRSRRSRATSARRDPARRRAALARAREAARGRRAT